MNIVNVGSMWWLNISNIHLLAVHSGIPQDLWIYLKIVREKLWNMLERSVRVG